MRRASSLSALVLAAAAAAALLLLRGGAAEARLALAALHVRRPPPPPPPASAARANASHRCGGPWGGEPRRRARREPGVALSAQRSARVRRRRLRRAHVRQPGLGGPLQTRLCVERDPRLREPGAALADVLLRRRRR